MAAVEFQLSKNQVKKDAAAPTTSSAIVAAKMKIYIGASVADGEKTTLAAGFHKLRDELLRRLKLNTSGNIVLSLEAPDVAQGKIVFATGVGSLTANSIALIYSGTFNGTNYTATGLANTTAKYLIELLNDYLGNQ